MYTLYIDKGFAEGYFALGNSEILQHFDKNILSQVNKLSIVTNCTEDDLISNENISLLFEKLKDSVYDINYIECDFDYNYIWNTSNHGGIVLYLTEAEFKEQENIIIKKGVEILSLKNIEKKWAAYKKYFIQEWVIDINSNESNNASFSGHSDFSFLKSFPMNSIVIQDHYILQSYQMIKSILFQILLSFLPNTIGKRLSLFIISQKILFKEKGKLGPIQKRISDVKSYINNFFSDKFPGLIVEINIVYYEGGHNVHLHDRRIYLNYFTISSTAGFEFVGSSSQIESDTEIRIECNFRPFRKDAILKQFSRIKKYCKKTDHLQGYNTDKLSSPLLKLNI